MSRRHFFGTVLVGNRSLLAEGVARILRSENFRIVASVSCADDFLSGKVHSHPLLFLIIHTGDNFDVVPRQVELLRGSNPAARIAVVADRYRPEELVSALQAGAHGYFVDVMMCDVFIKSLELVMMGETVLPSAFLPFMLDPERAPADHAGPRNAHNNMLLATTDETAPQLSPREKSILRFLIDGDSNKCIARKVDIAEATVKVHVKAILRKIRVQNRTQAAIWGMNNGWLAQPNGNGHGK
jgi:DNA-binding NarL/FixJ family response regulator